MKKIKVKTTTGSGDCECCGSWFCEDVDISFDGKEYSFSNDNHLGGSHWSDDKEVMIFLYALINNKSIQCIEPDYNKEFNPFYECGTYITFEIDEDLNLTVDGVKQDVEPKYHCSSQCNDCEERCIKGIEMFSTVAAKLITDMGYEIVYKNY